MRLTPVLFIPCLAAALAGCGPVVTAPSLNLRPVEQAPILLPADTREPEGQLDPALTATLAKQVDSAEAGERHFAMVKAEAEKAVSRATGAEAGSEGWTAAQEALSALDAARGAVRAAASAVETLRQEPANAGSGARAAIDKAAERIEDIESEEAATVAALTSRLR